MAKRKSRSVDVAPATGVAPEYQPSDARRGFARYVVAAAALCATQIVYTLVLFPMQRATVDLDAYYAVVNLPWSVVVLAVIPTLISAISFWLHWAILWSERLALREPTRRYLVLIAIHHFCVAALFTVGAFFLAMVIAVPQSRASDLAGAETLAGMPNLGFLNLGLLGILAIVVLVSGALASRAKKRGVLVGAGFTRVGKPAHSLGMIVLSAPALTRFVRLDCISPEVLLVGLQLGAIDRRDVVEIELQRLKADIPLTAAEESWALRLSDDLDLIPFEVQDAVGAASLDTAKHIWAFVGARLARGTWSKPEDLVYPISELLEELGEPEAYSAFYVHSLPLFQRNRDRGYRGKLDERLALDDAMFGRRDGGA